MGREEKREREIKERERLRISFFWMDKSEHNETIKKRAVSGTR